MNDFVDIFVICLVTVLVGFVVWCCLIGLCVLIVTGYYSIISLGHQLTSMLNVLPSTHLYSLV